MFSCPLDRLPRTFDIGNNLQVLFGLPGLVFINFCQQPVIGIFPKWQLTAFYHDNKANQSKSEHFATSNRQGSRQDDFTYLADRSVTDFKQQLEQLWEQTRHKHRAQSSNQTSTYGSSFLPFEGGLIGFTGYDYAASQWVPSISIKQQPLAIFGFYDVFLKYDADSKQWYLCSLTKSALNKALSYLISHFDQYTATRLSANPLKPIWSLDQYQRAFNQVENYILAGDCYQINLTQPWVSKINPDNLGNLTALANPLWNTTKYPPYSGYLAHEEFELLSCSPESFLRFNPDNQVITRPIKGTIHRSPDNNEDSLLALKLKNSEKDRAENLMIVDMLRNDLGQVSQTGSVQVPELFALKSFAQIHHLESTITACLQNSISPLAAFFSALPGGSITGTPKKRAIEIINELEVGPRGAYCGSLGFLNLNQTGEFNILIRTVQKNHQISLWAGGGITSHSQVKKEYQECFDKVGAMVNTINSYLST